MDINEVLKTRRSIRKFDGRPISDEILYELVDIARYAPAAANIQPLKFAVVNSKAVCDKIFPYTKWAKLLGEKGTPAKGEEPVAYIIVMSDVQKRMYKETDASFAIDYIVVSAWAKGIGTCILGAIDKNEIAKIIKMPEGYEINYAVALGWPAQESAAEDANGSVAYYMDESGKVHVPKRTIDEIMYKVE